MKQPVKTTLFAIGASLLLLLAALALVPFLLKDRVVELVRSQVNERLEATVDFEDVDLSLLSTFPTFTVEIVGLEIIGKGVFEGKQLASVRFLGAGMDPIRLIRDAQLLIGSLTIDPGARRQLKRPVCIASNATCDTRNQAGRFVLG